jgi:hypothetical protein
MGAPPKVTDSRIRSAARHKGHCSPIDSIWVSPELSVVAVSYPSNALVLGDYAAVLADVRVVEKVVVRRPM